MLNPLLKGMVKKVINPGTKKAIKIMEAGKRGKFSSAHTKLKGTELQLEEWDVPRVIHEVVDLGGNTRGIAFTDGTSLETTKQFVYEHVQAVSGGSSVKSAVSQGEERTMSHALTAMERHKAQREIIEMNKLWSKKQIRDEHQRRVRQAKIAGEQAVPYSLIESDGILFPISNDYAKMLVTAGQAKYIIKGQ